MKKKKKTPQNQSKLFHLRVTKGNDVLRVLASTNYDALLEEGMDLAKELDASWTVFNSRGIEIDGSLK